VADAQVERFGKFPDDELASQVGIDMGREPSRLPRRETAARDRSRAAVAGLTDCSRSRISVQQRYGAGDMRSRAIAVTVPCTTRRVDELGGHHQQIARSPLQQWVVGIGRTVGHWRGILRGGLKRIAIESSHARSVCD